VVIDRKALLGIGHGALWKIAALASKLGFVLFVLPFLSNGVFADYSVWMTVALVAALVLSLGAIDGLPIIVRGRPIVRNALAPLGQASLATTALFFLAFLLSGETWVLIVALVGCNICYLALSGLLRSTDPHLFEVLTNAPSVAFLLLCLAFATRDLNQLLLAFFVANFLISCGIAAKIGILRPVSVRELRYSAKATRWLAIRGNLKSISAILVIADFRTLLTTPGLLRGLPPTDALAVSLTVGEAFWQLGMVVVNRNFAKYCSGRGNLNSSVKTALYLLLLTSSIGLAFMILPLPSISKFDWPMVGWAVILFAAMAALSELRAYFWARDKKDHIIIGAQIAIVIWQALIVALVPPSYWLPMAAASFIFSTLAFILFLRLRFIGGTKR
jgi:hypothetical protein